MAESLELHNEGGMNKENDPKHQDVGESDKARNHDFSHSPNIHETRMLPALPVEEKEGNWSPLWGARGHCGTYVVQLSVQGEGRGDGAICWPATTTEWCLGYHSGAGTEAPNDSFRERRIETMTENQRLAFDRMMETILGQKEDAERVRQTRPVYNFVGRGTNIQGG